MGMDGWESNAELTALALPGAAEEAAGACVRCLPALPLV